MQAHRCEGDAGNVPWDYSLCLSTLTLLPNKRLKWHEKMHSLWFHNVSDQKVLILYFRHDAFFGGLDKIGWVLLVKRFAPEYRSKDAGVISRGRGGGRDQPYLLGKL